ncbi:hypothetical protein L1049_018531 [Liquidambar formosana]|uniref:Uncharacterized protein n=1 Tax=Liquidambar formosana TaxID=63359 RepID=A0AAP0RAV5_LIQFO
MSQPLLSPQLSVCVFAQHGAIIRGGCRSTGINKTVQNYVQVTHFFGGTFESGSNVRKAERKKPDPPCVVCKGSGRVDCHHCHGRGRTNYVHLVMLPKGEWPKWCKTCGGSGLSYCSRCLGTGEYRYLMGFHFMKKDADDTQVHKRYQVRGNAGAHSAADLLLNQEQSNSDHECEDSINSL